MTPSRLRLVLGSALLWLIKPALAAREEWTVAEIEQFQDRWDAANHGDDPPPVAEPEAA